VYGVYYSANTLTSIILAKVKTVNKNILVYGRLGLHLNFPMVSGFEYKYMFHKANGYEIVYAARHNGAGYDEINLRRMIAAKTLIEYDREFMNSRRVGIYYYDPEYMIHDDPFKIVVSVPLVICTNRRPVVCAYDGTRSKYKMIKKHDFSVSGMISVKKDDNLAIIADLMLKNNFDDKKIMSALRRDFPSIPYTAVTKLGAYKNIISYGSLDVRVLRAISSASNAPVPENKMLQILGDENKEYLNIFVKNSDNTYEYRISLDDHEQKEILTFPGLENTDFMFKNNAEYYS